VLGKQLDLQNDKLAGNAASMLRKMYQKTISRQSLGG
jgi:hypothetical protein